MTLPEDLTVRLRDADLDPRYVEDLVRAALEEDLAGGVDVTSEATVPAEQVGTAQFVARAGGVVSGLLVAEATLACVAEDDIEVRRLRDGAVVSEGDVLMSATGPVRALLLAERTALNLLCRMSGIATLTRHWVNAVSGTKAAIRDTRKTTPLLRPLEKYAVRCGGGENHRMSLSDAALIKDNHIVAAGGVAAAFKLVKEHFPEVPVEVEVTTADGAVEAVEAGADLILLDNMSVEAVKEAVEKVDGRARLEVSGGLTLGNARAYAETGVDFLAVGALTHSPRALDIAMDLKEVR